MNAMDSMHDTLVRVLKKYDLRTELPEAERTLIFAAKKRALTTILKKEGAWDFMGSAAINIFFRFVESGRSLSLGACERILRVSAAFAALIIISGAALTLHHFVIAPPGAVYLGTRGTVVFSLGDAKLQRPGAAPVAASVRDAVNEGDVLLTGGNSSLVVQIEGVGTVTLLPESRVAMASLLKNGTDTAAKLERGRMFSKIMKARGQTYEVNTSTCVASVRGTEFLAVYGDNRTEVHLLSGKVHVRPLAAKDGGADQEAGKVSVTDDAGNISMREMNAVERLEAEKLSLAPYIENLNDKTVTEINDIFKRREGKAREIDGKIRNESEKLEDQWRRLSPLDRLRARGKPLSMLHLRGGEKVAGSVQGRRGNSIMVDTGDGVVGVPAGDVIKRDEIK